MSKGTLNADEVTRLNQAVGSLAMRRINIDDSPMTDGPALLMKLRKLRAEAGRLDLVVIDYLQLMQSSRYAGNRVQEVSHVSRTLKIIAKELRVPMVVMSQLSRDSEKRKDDHEPRLSDLRESGSIEQDADVVIAPFRPELYDRDREDLKGVAHGIILKQREGPIGKFNMAYLAAFTRFDNPASDGPAWNLG
jgi:replicative DNA helicase